MYIILWEFEAAPERIEGFLSTYSSHGEWAQLFRQAPGYLGTELLESCEAATRFHTIDRWAHEDDYEDFKLRFAQPYAALDARCQGLTLSERKLGAFQLPTLLPPAPAAPVRWQPR